VFSALGIDYHARLLPSTVSASWTDDSPESFFPIRRDEYPQQNSPSDLLPAERILSVDDYHPFLHVATLASWSSQRPATASKAISRAVRSSARFT